MKRSCIATFALAAVIGIATLSSSAHAGGLLGDLVGRTMGKAMGVPDYSYLSNQKYKDCVSYVGGFNSNFNYPGKEANIRKCQRMHLR